MHSLTFPTAPRAPGPGPSIGVLVDSVRGEYQSGVLQGVLETCQARGARAICFLGGPLPGGVLPTGGRDKLYRLANPANVEGIVTVASLGHASGEASLSTFLRRYHPLPIAAVGAELPDMPSVFPDNGAGMDALVRHLIQVHGARRLAFVSGPPTSLESRERLSAARAAALDLGVQLDPRLIVEGDFMPESGFRAVTTLAAVPGIRLAELDAIVAANDGMAFGVLAALERRGIRVPEEIAVTGFDDSEEAQVARPPLTTVRQPLAQQGAQAVALVLDQLRGLKPDTCKLAATTILRRSCGCGAETAKPIRSEPPQAGLGLDAALLMQRSALVVALRRATAGTFSGAGDDWADRLVNATVSDVQGARGALDKEFSRLLDRLMMSETPALDPCEEVLDILRRQVVPLLRGHPEQQYRMESAFHQARNQLALVTRRWFTRRALSAGQGCHQLSEVCLGIASSFDRDETARLVETALPPLQIRTCIVVEYALKDPSRGPSEHAKGRVFAAFDLDTNAPVARGQEVAEGRLAPPGFREAPGDTLPLMVLPLCAQGELLGHVLFEGVLSRAYAYGPIAESIAIALHGHELRVRSGLAKP